MTEAQTEAIANADAHTNNACLPSYTELFQFVSRLANPERGELLILEDYRNIARNKLKALHD